MRRRAHSRWWQVGAMAVGMAVLSPRAVPAQNDTTDTVVQTQTRTVEHEDHDFPWGLFGLLGLLGLLPKRKKDVHVHETRETYTAPPRDPIPPRDPMAPRDRVDPNPPR
jgi:hypothetical protein